MTTDLIELRLLAVAFWLIFSAVAVGALIGLKWLSDGQARRRAERAAETRRPPQAPEHCEPAAAVPEQKKALSLGGRGSGLALAGAVGEAVGGAVLLARDVDDLE